MRTKIQRIKVLERARLKKSAGEELGAVDMVDIHVIERTCPEEPTVVDPAEATYRPQNTVDVTNIADIGTSVRQKCPFLAVRLLRKGCEELTECDLYLRFAAKSSDDTGIKGGLEQPVDDELFGDNFALLDFRQEVLFEAVTETAYLHLGLPRRIGNEVFVGRERCDGRNTDRGRQAFEKPLSA